MARTTLSSLAIPIVLLATLVFAGCESESESSSIKESEGEVSTITDALTLQVPSAGWSLNPTGVYQNGDALICIYQLQAPQGMAAQVISKVSCAIQFEAPDLPRKQFVLGKTWSWNSNPGVRFIDSLDEIESDLKGAQSQPFTQVAEH